MSEAKKGPAYIASVTETFKGSDGKENTYWTDVGVAFPHKDGDGFNVVIRKGLSVSGTLVLRTPRQGDKEKPADGNFPGEEG